jgi:hypothetical protein
VARVWEKNWAVSILSNMCRRSKNLAADSGLWRTVHWLPCYCHMFIWLQEDHIDRSGYGIDWTSQYVPVKSALWLGGIDGLQLLLVADSLNWIGLIYLIIHVMYTWETIFGIRCVCTRLTPQPYLITIALKTILFAENQLILRAIEPSVTTPFAAAFYPW